MRVGRGRRTREAAPVSGDDTLAMWGSRGGRSDERPWRGANCRTWSRDGTSTTARGGARGREERVDATWGGPDRSDRLFGRLRKLSSSRVRRGMKGRCRSGNGRRRRRGHKGAGMKACDRGAREGRAGCGGPLRRMGAMNRRRVALICGSRASRPVDRSAWVRACASVREERRERVVVVLPLHERESTKRCRELSVVTGSRFRKVESWPARRQPVKRSLATGPRTRASPVRSERPERDPVSRPRRPTPRLAHSRTPNSVQRGAGHLCLFGRSEVGHLSGASRRDERRAGSSSSSLGAGVRSFRGPGSSSRRPCED